jgi:uncharacterized protein
MSGPADLAASSADRTRARRGLLIFLSLMVAFNAVFVAALTVTGDWRWIYAMPWSVALSSVIARLVVREGVADVSFRLGGPRTLYWIVVGVIYPLVVTLVAFGAAWLTGLAPFVPPPAEYWVALLFNMAVGTVFAAFTAVGEEIGWRGYLLIRLIDAGVPRPVLVSGVIWGLWYVPLIVAGLAFAEHPSMLAAIVVSMVWFVAAGFLLARARLETGSIWPCVVQSIMIQVAFWPEWATAGMGAAFWHEGATGGEDAVIWLGREAGILVAAAMVLAALVLCRGSWTFKRTPDQPMAAPSAL